MIMTCGPCSYHTLINIVGIPILRLDVCSESEATLSCAVNESTTLQWDIDFLDDDTINRVSFFLGDTIGRSISPARGTGVKYTFRLISLSPLTSTVTTSKPTDLYGTTIKCSNGLQSSAHVATCTLGKCMHPI